MEIQHNKTGHSKSSSKQKVHRKKCPHHYTSKISIKQPKVIHLKELENEEQMKPKVSRKKEVTKIKAGINAIKTKKTIKKMNETKN